jgi:hypothetical protein
MDKPPYVFTLLNHLGEPLERDCDAEAAEALARDLARRGYPVEVRNGGEVLGVRQPSWSLEDWLRPYLGSWPIS